MADKVNKKASKSNKKRPSKYDEKLVVNAASLEGFVKELVTPNLQANASSTKYVPNGSGEIEIEIDENSEVNKGMANFLKIYQH